VNLNAAGAPVNRRVWSYRRARPSGDAPGFPGFPVNRTVDRLGRLWPNFLVAVPFRLDECVAHVWLRGCAYVSIEFKSGELFGARPSPPMSPPLGLLSWAMNGTLSALQTSRLFAWSVHLLLGSRSVKWLERSGALPGPGNVTSTALVYLPYRLRRRTDPLGQARGCPARAGGALNSDGS